MRYGTVLSTGEIILEYEVFLSLKGSITNSFCVIPVERRHRNGELEDLPPKIVIILPNKNYKVGETYQGCQGTMYYPTQVYWIDANGDYEKVCTMCPGYMKCALEEFKRSCHLGLPDLAKEPKKLPVNEQYCDFSSINLISQRKAGILDHPPTFAKLDKESVTRKEQELHNESKLIYKRKKHREEFCSKCVCKCRPTKTGLDRVVTVEDFKLLLETMLEVRFGSSSRFEEMMKYSFIRESSDTIKDIAPWLKEFFSNKNETYTVTLTPLDRFSMYLSVENQSHLRLSFDEITQCTKPSGKIIDKYKLLTALSYLSHGENRLLDRMKDPILNIVKEAVWQGDYETIINIPLFHIRALENGNILSNEQLIIKAFIQTCSILATDLNIRNYKKTDKNQWKANSGYHTPYESTYWSRCDDDVSTILRVHRFPKD